jgi:hypothetical protein
MKKLVTGLTWVVVIAGAAGVVMAGQAAPANGGASSAKAKEVASLMAAKKLETFATKDPEQSKQYVAVLLVPDVQLLLVSAVYSRDNDIEYSLYHKQYQNAYSDLRSGVYGSNRFLVDDVQINGLVAVPGKNPMHDAVMIDTTKHVFDGLFGDGKGRNAKKPLEQVYMKAFTDAEARYTKLLDLLIAQLKAGEKVTAPLAMR